MQTNIYGFSEEQNSSVQIVLFTMVGAMLLDGDTYLTMGDVVTAIVEGTKQKSPDWTWYVELDAHKHTAVFHAKYRN